MKYECGALVLRDW